MNTICFPDYKHSILNITATLLHYYNAPCAYVNLEKLDKTLKEHQPKNVVFMIFDAMGVDIIKKNLPENSFLATHISDEITSVFPPTTTAATTTFYSGKSPIEHGWLGWMCFFKNFNKAIELFRNTDFYTGEKLDVDTYKELPYETIYEQIKKASNGQVQTHKIFPKDIDKNGYDQMADMENRIVAATQEKGQQFILAYNPFPDKLMHHNGTCNKVVQENLVQINKTVERLAKTLKDTLIVVSADHGHIDVTKEYYIENYPDFMECLKYPLSLEDRVVSIFLKDGKKEQFLQSFNRYFSNDFILMTHEEVLQKQLFGIGQINPKAKEFIGDYLIISKSGCSIRQKGVHHEEFKGSHAGLLKAEMIVPLILAHCKE